MNIFISHNSADAEYAAKLVKLLIVGMGVNKEDIFCSSVDGVAVPIGIDFQDHIKNKLNENGLVIALISKSYYLSTFSMYELGAAWASGKKTIPMLFETEFDDLRHFLSTKVSVKAERSHDLNKLKDDLEALLDCRSVTNTWEHERNEFVSFVEKKKLEAHGERDFSPSLNLVPSKNKYKLVAFDLDGTILQGANFRYSWKAVWEYLGFDDEIRTKLYDRHMDDPLNYTYGEWCKDCVTHFIDKGFCRDDVAKIIKKNKIRLAPGVRPTLEVLKAQGIYTVIISGGIDTFLEVSFKQKIEKLFDRVYINKFEYDHDNKLVGVRPQDKVESDFSGKLAILESLCSELNCNIGETVFVGEGINDKQIGSSPCLSIAYPANKSHPSYLSVADKKIYEPNLVNILPNILVAP